MLKVEGSKSLAGMDGFQIRLAHQSNIPASETKIPGSSVAKSFSERMRSRWAVYSDSSSKPTPRKEEKDRDQSLLTVANNLQVYRHLGGDFLL